MPALDVPIAEHRIRCQRDQDCPDGYVQLPASQDTPVTFECLTCGEMAVQVAMRVVGE